MMGLGAVSGAYGCMVARVRRGLSTWGVNQNDGPRRPSFSRRLLHNERDDEQGDDVQNLDHGVDGRRCWPKLRRRRSEGRAGR